MCISFSKLFYEREDFRNTYRKPTYIQYYSICQTLTSSVITICEVTVRTISIIVHLSNTLQRILAVVRTSIYNNTACILRTVSMVLWHLPSEGVYSRLSMYSGMALIDSNTYYVFYH